MNETVGAEVDILEPDVCGEDEAADWWQSWRKQTVAGDQEERKAAGDVVVEKKSQ